MGKLFLSATGTFAYKLLLKSFVEKAGLTIFSLAIWAKKIGKRLGAHDLL
jgi:hypothetical protein